MSPPSPSRAGGASLSAASSVRASSVSSRLGSAGAGEKELQAPAVGGGAPGPSSPSPGGKAGPARQASVAASFSPSSLSGRAASTGKAASSQTSAASVAAAGKSGKAHFAAPPAPPAVPIPPPQRQLRSRPVDATKRLFIIRRYEDLEQLAEEEGVRIDPIQLGFLSPTEFVEEDMAASAVSTNASSHRGHGAGGAGPLVKKKKQKMIVVPPIQIEESHDADLPDFIRPDHYIRFEQHRDQPTGLRLPDGSLVHYDMLKEDEIFVRELNRRIAHYAPPSLLSSVDLFTLDDSCDRAAAAKGEETGDAPEEASREEAKLGAKETQASGGVKGEEGDLAANGATGGSGEKLNGAAFSAGGAGATRAQPREEENLQNSAQAGEDAAPPAPGRLFEGAAPGSRKRKGEDEAEEAGEGREKKRLALCSAARERGASTLPVKGELFLSEMAFVKMIDAFEKEVHAKSGNEHALTHKDAVRIARDELKLQIHPVLVKQVQHYWLEKRQKLGKPLLRHFWPPCSPSDVSPLAVFRPRQAGREKMTLRKQKRVGKDTLLRAERLLEDIKVVERLLRRMRSRDEKKEQLLEVQCMAFDQMRFELSDPLYRHPLWDAFRERLAAKSERSGEKASRRHAAAAEKRLGAARLAGKGDDGLARNVAFSGVSAASRRRDKSAFAAAGAERDDDDRRGAAAAAPGDKRDAGDKRRLEEADGDDLRKKREAEEENGTYKTVQQVDAILGDGSPPWVAWSGGNPHFRPCFFPPASTFAYLSSLASSSTSPLPPSLVPPPPPFLNDGSSFSSGPTCRVVRRRGRGGRLWLDRLLCRPSPSSCLSQNAFLPSSRFSARLPHASLHKSRAALAGGAGDKFRGSAYNAAGDGEEANEGGDGKPFFPPQEDAEFGAGGLLCEGASAARREDGDASEERKGKVQGGGVTDGAADAARKEDEGRRGRRTSAGGEAEDVAPPEAASSSRAREGSSGRNATTAAAHASQAAQLWRKDGAATAMQKTFAAWPRQQGLYVQPRRDDEAGGTDRYSPPFATADGVDASANTEGFHVFSLHRHLAQQEQLASAAASFAASSTLPPRTAPDAFASPRHVPASAPGVCPLTASPRSVVGRPGAGALPGLRGQEALNAGLLQPNAPGVSAASLGAQGGPAGLASIPLSAYAPHPSACPPFSSGSLHALSGAAAAGYGHAPAHVALASAPPGVPGAGPPFFPTSAANPYFAASHPFSSFPASHPAASSHLVVHPTAGPGGQPPNLAAQFASRGTAAGPAGAVDFSASYGSPGAPGGLSQPSATHPSFYNPATGVPVVSPAYPHSSVFLRPPPGAPGPAPGAYPPQQQGRPGRPPAGRAAGQGVQYFYARPPAPGPMEPNKAGPAAGAGDAGTGSRETDDGSARTGAFPSPAAGAYGSAHASGPPGFAGGRGQSGSVGGSPAGGSGPAGGSAPGSGGGSGGAGSVGPADNGFFGQSRGDAFGSGPPNAGFAPQAPAPGTVSSGAQGSPPGNLAMMGGSGGSGSGGGATGTQTPLGSAAGGASSGASQVGGHPPEYSNAYRQQQFVVNPIQQGGPGANYAQFFGAAPSGDTGGEPGAGPPGSFPPSAASGPFYPPARGGTVGTPRAGAGAVGRVGGTAPPSRGGPSPPTEPVEPNAAGTATGTGGAPDQDPVAAAAGRQSAHANFKGWMRSSVPSASNASSGVGGRGAASGPASASPSSPPPGAGGDNMPVPGPSSAPFASYPGGSNPPSAGPPAPRHGYAPPFASPYVDCGRGKSNAPASASSFEAPGAAPGQVPGADPSQSPFGPPSSQSPAPGEMNNYMYAGGGVPPSAPPSSRASSGVAGGSGPVHPFSFTSGFPCSFQFPGAPAHYPPGAHPHHVLNAAQTGGVPTATAHAPSAGAEMGGALDGSGGSAVDCGVSKKGSRKNAGEAAKKGEAQVAGENQAFRSAERGERGRFVSPYPGALDGAHKKGVDFASSHGAKTQGGNA
ncbi:hypothetical protein BESB_061660 [Besnoitia besnoiti]|uniref:Enhancer of polycomb-like protein n=1 Tax=Besnoitia besnoiti TaxID=94643 RepID=A0A2A9MBM2_BESBE|nr:hypothetical protein BESB_061660 [Besnoitia besnoiti]PFH35279.1 hypothetical protein BESB_061660 [Besnoitia besnoiti]